MSFAPDKTTYPRTIWLGLLVALLCAAYGSHVRLQQFRAWEENPARYMAGDVPLMTTRDAYYSLRYASKYMDGSYLAEADDPLRFYQRRQYPRGESVLFPNPDSLQWLPQRQPKDFPLLSWVLATTAPLFGGIFEAGIYLIPLLSSLFMIPLFLYAWRGDSATRAPGYSVD